MTCRAETHRFAPYAAYRHQERCRPPDGLACRLVLEPRKPMIAREKLNLGLAGACEEGMLVNAKSPLRAESAPDGVLATDIPWLGRRAASSRALPVT